MRNACLAAIHIAPGSPVAIATECSRTHAGLNPTSSSTAR